MRRLPTSLREIVEARRSNTTDWGDPPPLHHTLVTDEGIQVYQDERGLISRDDGPAIIVPVGCEAVRGLLLLDSRLELHTPRPTGILSNPNSRAGAEFWLKGGRLHRPGGEPAIIIGGEQWERQWWLEGALHRDGDQPAVECADGRLEWWEYGECHRDERLGPARIEPSGTREWLRYGKRHRESGPAVEHSSGRRDWWVDGKRHREDGPAREFANGRREWWVDGKRHREDGPAREFANGRREWWVDGKRHREDGPAVILANGEERWYWRGVHCTREDVVISRRVKAAWGRSRARRII